MPSSLFGNPQAKPQSQPMNDGNLLHRFAEFKRQMAGKDPEKMVKELLAQGKMSPQQFEKLKEYGCTFFQGKYLSEPLQKSKIVDYIKSVSKT